MRIEDIRLEGRERESTKGLLIKMVWTLCIQCIEGERERDGGTEGGKGREGGREGGREKERKRERERE